MSIRYNIDPKLDFRVYIFEGECTAREYFDLYHVIYINDKRRHHGMKVILDITNGALNLDSGSLREAKQIIADNKAKGYPRDQLAILTTESGFNLLMKAFKILAEELPMDLDLFYNPKDAIDWLMPAEEQEPSIRFWQNVKLQRPK
ncbi:MAG: hypothetical protein ACKOGC_08355 [Anaerolineae bacterium]